MSGHYADQSEPHKQDGKDAQNAGPVGLEPQHGVGPMKERGELGEALIKFFQLGLFFSQRGLMLSEFLLEGIAVSFLRRDVAVQIIDGLFVRLNRMVGLNNRLVQK